MVRITYAVFYGCHVGLHKRQIQQTFLETALNQSGAKTQTINDLVCTEVKNCSSGRGGSSFCWFFSENILICKNIVEIVAEIQFLIGGGVLRSYSPGALSTIFLWKSALTMCVIQSVFFQTILYPQSLLGLLRLCTDTTFRVLINVTLYYTVFRKKHPLTFSFISPWMICRFKQKLQWIYLRNDR